MKIKNFKKRYGCTGHANKTCLYIQLTKNLFKKSKRFEFFVCNLNQIGTQNIVFKVRLAKFFIFFKKNCSNTSKTKNPNI